MNNPDNISAGLETVFWAKILKFVDTDLGSGMEKIGIRDKHPVSATIVPSKNQITAGNKDFIWYSEVYFYVLYTVPYCK
jgi:hypothetical protein